MHLERVPLIVTYHPGLPPLRSILNKDYSILNGSEKLRELVVKNPPFVAYRRLPNLEPYWCGLSLHKNNNYLTRGIPSANRFVVRPVDTSSQ